jgi:hypothetical protein
MNPAPIARHLRYVAETTNAQADLLIAAAVSGGGSIVKAGPGTMQMSGINAYTATWNGGLFRFAGAPIADDLQHFVVGSNRFALDYDDGGARVTLIAVPEPTGAASLPGGFALLAGLRRRRRSPRAAVIFPPLPAGACK